MNPCPHPLLKDFNVEDFPTLNWKSGPTNAKDCGSRPLVDHPKNGDISDAILQDIFGLRAEIMGKGT